MTSLKSICEDFVSSLVLNDDGGFVEVAAVVPTVIAASYITEDDVVAEVSANKTDDGCFWWYDMKPLVTTKCLKKRGAKSLLYTK